MVLQENKQWYEIDNVDEIDSPVFVIYPDRVKKNISTLIEGIDNVNRLRPHIKTHKCKDVIDLLMDAGIKKFKCATIAEAELLGICNAPDVLLAYQPVGPKLRRFVSLIQKFPSTSFSCLVDNLISAKQMDAVAKENNLKLGIYLDLNVGMNRTGIKPGIEALELYKAVGKLGHVNLLGLHAYDGHIYETNLTVRTAQCMEIFSMVSQLVDSLATNGFSNIKLIMGGSPSFPIYAKLKEVECSPGTFVFWDKNYLDTLPEQSYVPAAVVVTRVISIPEQDKLCLDLGHKAIASENELNCRVYFLNDPGLQPVGHSEEHLVVKADKNHSYKIGDVLYVLPFHICPTCALYREAYISEDGMLTGKWEILARNREISV